MIRKVNKVLKIPIDILTMDYDLAFSPNLGEIPIRRGVDSEKQMH
jgi:hypothetical protein